MSEQPSTITAVEHELLYNHLRKNADLLNKASGAGKDDSNYYRLWHDRAGLPLIATDGEYENIIEMWEKEFFDKHKDHGPSLSFEEAREVNPSLYYFFVEHDKKSEVKKDD